MRQPDRGFPLEIHSMKWLQGTNSTWVGQLGLGVGLAAVIIAPLMRLLITPAAQPSLAAPTVTSINPTLFMPIEIGPTGEEEWAEHTKHGYGKLKRDNGKVIVFSFGLDGTGELALSPRVSAFWRKYQKALGPIVNHDPDPTYENMAGFLGSGIFYHFRDGVIMEPDGDQPLELLTKKEFIHRWNTSRAQAIKEAPIPPAAAPAQNPDPRDERGFFLLSRPSLW